jgi:VanZ family protein
MRHAVRIVNRKGATTGPLERWQRAFGAAALLAIAFVCYASLVPLDYSPRPLHEALAAFAPPPLVALDALDRADWLANLVLFASLAFVTLASLGTAPSQAMTLARGAVALAGLALLGVVIEFAQLWFPPRSVTLNDLAAECAGLALGALAWRAAGGRVVAIARPFFRDGSGARGAFALAFATAYIGIALFPFDFVVDAAEMRARLASGLVGAWLAPAACEIRSLCIASLAMQFAGAVAFGIALRFARPSSRTPAWIEAIAIGSLVGVGVEAMQLLLVSGIAQGASALARALGAALGVRIAAGVPHVVNAVAAYRMPRALLGGAALAYLIVLTVANGLATSRWLAPPIALQRLYDVAFVPFYYHYYVSEQRALASAIVHLAMYAPVGALVALALPRAPGGVAAWLAALCALAVETAKLFAGARPDPTDVLLAAIAGLGTHTLVRWLVDTRAMERGRAFALPNVAIGPLTPIAFVLALAAVLAVLAYPGPRLMLSLGLAAYALILFRDPAAWLVALPALLPVLDLAQWTGALFVDEFDLAVVTTLAVLCLRTPSAGAGRWPPALAVVLVLGAVATGAGLLQGLLPLDPLTPDSFASVHSSFNAWRVGRGPVFALALLLLLRRWSEGPDADLPRFARGMTLGLAGVALVMLWERTTFAGWADFGIEYRAVGALSAASTAGAQTEAFIAAALPFALLVAATSAALAWRTLAVAALLASAYAIAATLSRAAWGAALVAIALFCVGLALRIPLARHARRGLALIVPITALIAGVAALAIAERFPQSIDDFAARRGHWMDVLAPRAGELRPLTGHGFGVYPRHYYWHASPEARPSLFSYRAERGTTFARVSPGSTTYLDQVVRVDAGATLALRARVRSERAGSVVAFTLCEKWILHATRCREARFSPTQTGVWQPLAVELAAPDGRGAALWRPTVKLSIHMPRGGGPMDVTDVALVGPGGRDYVRNGRFALASTHWLLSADDHWPWNTFNLLVEVLFEQGWLVVAGLVVTLAYVFTAIGRRATRADLVAAAFVAALAAFLVPAMFDALIDEPRMRLLLALLVALPLLAPGALRTAR